jgi:N-acetylglucosamine-6-phosphate deacetylase
VIIAAGHVVTPDGVLSPGWIRVTGAVIEAVGQGDPPAPGPAAPPPAAAPASIRGHWALPGFIDMHVHGGGGTSFTEGGEREAERAAAFHRIHGTTRAIASLVTAPAEVLARRVSMLADLADDHVIDGIHLEGPFLSPARRGAQDPRYLIPPDVALFERLRAAARGWLRMITIAPELPGATEVIRAAVDAGVIASAGHTDASAEVTSAAVDAGITHATHLFNGMRPLGHREPGPVGALLDRAGGPDGTVSCEVIADGTHLHDTAIRLVARAAGPGNLVLVTDAVTAAGMADGDYRLGELDVTVSGGVARLAGPAPGTTGAPGAIAGSTATMDAVVRRAITSAGLSVTQVARAAATTPARQLGLGAVTGALRPGLAADIVVLDAGLQVSAVLARGQLVPG